MLSFFLLFILYGTNSLSLLPMENSNKTANLLSDLQSDPKKFVSEVSNLNPSDIKHIVSLLEALLEESENRETELDNDLSDKNTALADADTAVTEAKNVLAAEELEVTQAKADLEAKETAHSNRLTEKETSQQNHDDEVPSLNDEQEVLRNVIDLLMGLHDKHSGGAGCSPAATSATEIDGTGIYACEGSWTTPGIVNGGIALCGDSTELCDYSGINVLTPDQCNNLLGNKFFGTFVSSHGGWQCIHQDDASGANDIWGCGNACSNGGATCGGTLKCAIGNSNFGGWQGLPHSTTEKNHVYHTSETGGGVMCCPKA